MGRSNDHAISGKVGRKIFACLMSLMMAIMLVPAAGLSSVAQAETTTDYSQSDGFQPYQGWQSAPWIEAQDPWAPGGGGTTRKGYPGWELVTPLSKGVTAYSGDVANPVTTGSDINILTDYSGGEFSTDTSTAGTFEDPYYYKNIVLTPVDATADQTFTFSYVGPGGANTSYLYDGHGGIFLTTSDNPSDWGSYDDSTIFQPSDNVVWQASAANTTLSNTNTNWWKNISVNVPANTLKSGETYYLVVHNGTAGRWGRLYANIVFKISTDTSVTPTWTGDETQARYGFEQGNGGCKMGIFEPAAENVVTDLTKIDYCYYNTDNATVYPDDSGNVTLRL